MNCYSKTTRKRYSDGYLTPKPFVEIKTDNWEGKVDAIYLGSGFVSPSKGWKLVKTNSSEYMEYRFYELATSWKNETKGYSLAASKINNYYYSEIIKLGLKFKDKIVELILKDLSKSSSYWYYALKKITNENPVSKGLASDMEKTRELWLKWGYDNGIIK